MILAGCPVYVSCLSIKEVSVLNRRNFHHLLTLLPFLFSCKKNDNKEIISVSNDSLSAFHDITEAPKPIQDIAPATVLLGQRGTGSFVRYNDQVYLMTNNHVLGAGDCPQEGCFIWVAFSLERGGTPSATRMKLTPVAASPDIDVAFYSAETVDKNYAVLTPYSLDSALPLTPYTAADLRGQTIHLVGHPASGLKKWSQGQVLMENNKFVSTTSFAIGGSSGSPVVRDDGTLVAIHHSGNRSIDNITERSFNRVSHHSPTQLLINVLEDGLRGREQGSSFPFRSLSDATLSDRERVFLHIQARTPIKFSTDDQTAESFASMLQDQCATALTEHEQTPAVNTATFGEKIQSCALARLFLSCQKTDRNPAYLCPTSESAEAWKGLFVRVANGRERYAGSDPRDYLGYPIARLYTDKARGEDEARNQILTHLRATNGQLTAYDAYTLIDFGASTERVGDTTPAEYVLQHRNRAHYWLEYSEIIPSIELLARKSLINSETLRETFAKTAQDPNLGLRARLELEASALWWGLLTW